jgi:hypothetical protein
MCIHTKLKKCGVCMYISPTRVKSSGWPRIRHFSKKHPTGHRSVPLQRVKLDLSSPSSKGDSSSIQVRTYLPRLISSQTKLRPAILRLSYDAGLRWRAVLVYQSMYLSCLGYGRWGIFVGRCPKAPVICLSRCCRQIARSTERVA